VNAVGMLVLMLFIGGMIVYATIGRRWPAVFRPLPAYDDLSEAIEEAVEAGERVHVSLGTGSVIGTDVAPALVGLTMASKIAEITSVSDRPVVVTAGDAAMALLAQDTLRTTYNRINASEAYSPSAGRMLGPTPFSYIAGLPVLIDTEKVSVHVLAGSFGYEGALAVDFGTRQGAFCLGGTDDVQSQALIYATAEDPLVGEELFAAGAYFNQHPIHRAGLRVQDLMRMIIIGAILAGTILRILRALGAFS
jgi:hypothetical protein